MARKSRKELVDEQLAQLRSKLGDTPPPLLTPPLKLLGKACEATQCDLGNSFVRFLQHWEDSGRWIYPANLALPNELEQPFAHIDWSNVPEEHLKGCAWLATLAHQLGERSPSATLVEALQEHCWPFLQEIEQAAKEQGERGAWELFSQQVILLGAELPVLALKSSSAMNNAAVFSSYCRAYGLSLYESMPTAWERAPVQELTLECPLTSCQKPLPPTPKLEENIPLLVLDCDKEEIALAYDQQAEGLKWPVAKGKYLARFQPLFLTLPYEVHLRRARQISYPNTNMPHAYESDLIITDKRTNHRYETTISMNMVYETWDGYRFYLASMTPGDESSAKRVQIVVNQDPAKYFLTYSGATTLTLGIFLLFWLRPYARNKRKQ